MDIRETAKFLLLGFIVFVLNTTVLRGTSLDLLMLYSVLGALLWDVRGGLIAGAWSGFLAASVSAVPLFTVIFYYALIGYLSALILDSTLREAMTQKLIISLVLAGLSAVASGVLFIPSRLPELQSLQGSTILLHTALLFCLLQAESRFRIDRRAIARRILR